MKQTWSLVGMIFVSMALAVACDPTAAPKAVPTERPTSTLAPSPQATSTSVPVPTDPPPPTMAPTPTIPPSPITFVVQDNYTLGQDITIRNNGPISYFYTTYYPACYNLSFNDESLKVRRIESFGEIRELATSALLITQGTQCDLAGDTELLPGEEAVLIRWDQQECVIDNWGCAESIPAPAGDYNIVGRFYETQYPREGETTAKWSFTIRP